MDGPKTPLQVLGLCLWAGEVAQEIKWLLNKHEDQSSDPQQPCKSWQVWQLPVLIADTGGRDRSKLASKTSYYISKVWVPLRDLDSINKVENVGGRLLMSTSGLHMHTYVYTHPCMQVCQHTYAHSYTHSCIPHSTYRCTISKQINNLKIVKDSVSVRYYIFSTWHQ